MRMIANLRSIVEEPHDAPAQAIESAKKRNSQFWEQNHPAPIIGKEIRECKYSDDVFQIWMENELTLSISVSSSGRLSSSIRNSVDVAPLPESPHDVICITWKTFTEE